MLIKDIFRTMRDYRILKSIWSKINNGVVNFRTRGFPKGDVLISYINFPFLLRDQSYAGHSNRWECAEIVRIFISRGYNVDVIDWKNKIFKPKKSYTYVLDIHDNLERLSPFLNDGCLKIFHATTSYCKFQNEAEEKRLSDLKKRRGVELVSRRNITPASSYELADRCTIIGNDFTQSTYPNQSKIMDKIHISTTNIFESPQKKDFYKIKNNYIWMGGYGCVHKGLDLVLEAFTAMPEFNLIICGSIQKEKDFERVYRKELYETGNIKLQGSIDTGSREFEELCQNSLGIVYPSCSEGTAGSVVTSMHAGLIPIVSKETGVDVKDFGLQLRDNTIQDIIDNVRSLSSNSIQELKRRSIQTWEYARKYHTRDNFTKEFSEFIEKID